MRVLLLNLVLLFLHGIMIPVYIWRRFKRMRFRANLRGARAAYAYAKWVDEHSVVKGANVHLQTSVGMLRYTRPLTVHKLMVAYRDR